MGWFGTDHDRRQPDPQPEGVNRPVLSVNSPGLFGGGYWSRVESGIDPNED